MCGCIGRIALMFSICPPLAPPHLTASSRRRTDSPIRGRAIPNQEDDESPLVGDYWCDIPIRDEGAVGEDGGVE